MRLPCNLGGDYRHLVPEFNPAEVNFSYALIQDDKYFAPSSPPMFNIQSNDIINIARQIAARFQSFAAWGQDSMQLSSRLTLSLGARWDIAPAPVSLKEFRNPLNDFFRTNIAVDGLCSPFLSQVCPLVLARKEGELYPTRYTNLAPRLGIALRLSNRSGRETILRGGMGLVYDLATEMVGSTISGVQLPYGSTFLRQNCHMNKFQCLPSILGLEKSESSMTELSYNYSATFISPSLAQPRIYQWDIALEQSINKEQSISVSYVGSAGRKLVRTDAYSYSNDNKRWYWDPPSFFQFVSNAASSNYHSLQLYYQKRLSSGLQGRASYTWAHAIDNASTSALRFVNDRSSSDFDVRHSFVGSVSWATPQVFQSGLARFLSRDWVTTSLVRLRSALPIDIQTSGELDAAFYNKGLVQVFRPDLVPGVPVWLTDPSVPGNRRINLKAFTVRENFSPAPGSVSLFNGNLPRNAFRSFPLLQIDLSLQREFTLNSQMKILFKTDLFNLLNHPSFGAPWVEFIPEFYRIVPENKESIKAFGLAQQMLNRELGRGAVGNNLNPLYQVGGARSIVLSAKLSF